MTVVLLPRGDLGPALAVALLLVAPLLFSLASHLLRKDHP